MALTISPAAIPSPKKNSFFSVTFTTAGGILPIVSWVVTVGTLPTWMTLTVVDNNHMLLSGKVPKTLAATGSALTITATDSTPVTPLTATVTLAASGTVVDGPDEQGIHTTEALRATEATIDQFRQSPGVRLTPADWLARQWPLGGRAQ